MADAFQQTGALPVNRDYLDVRLLGMENRLMKWGIDLALGQITLLTAIIKLL